MPYGLPTNIPSKKKSELNAKIERCIVHVMMGKKSMSKDSAIKICKDSVLGKYEKDKNKK